jgi:subtilisin family serine protease
MLTFAVNAFAEVELVEPLPMWAKSYEDLEIITLQAMEEPQERKERISNTMRSLFRKRSVSGEVPVIIEVDSSFIPEGFLSSNSKSVQRTAISAAQTTMLDSLGNISPHYRNKNYHRFESVPMISTSVSYAEIEDFASLPQIKNVYEDELSEISMGESNPLIGSNIAWADGATGDGQVVAVLDTGVQKTHPFLSGKVVSEACYSNAGGAGSGITLCPGGAVATNAVGSGVNCNAAVEGCSHGTHVAGTIAGNSSTIKGVAPDAKIIAINVFTNIGGRALAYSSDIIKALERVYALRNTYDIASVNMSLGGGRYTGYCNTDSRKTIIDNLRSAGIATVIASGNDGYTDSVSAPGCISSAITVGSSTDSSFGVADRVSSFSNSAVMIDLLAPGQYIRSSVPGGGYSSWHGTSMATPHVAGAWALLMSATNTATVTEVEEALETTGTMITDTTNSLSKPRIWVNKALDSFGTGSVTVDIEPAGAVSDGAKWSVDGGDWNDSGDTVSDLSLGSHTIVFGSVTNSDGTKVWVSPNTRTITIAQGGDSVEVTGTYSSDDKLANSRDFNGDGKGDIVWRNRSNGSLLVWFMDGEVRIAGDFFKNPNGTVKTLPYNKWGIAGIEDSNADGKPDVLFLNEDNGYFVLWGMDGSTLSSVRYVTDINSTVKTISTNIWQMVGYSDMDGDDKADILMINKNNGAVLLWSLNGEKITAKNYLKKSNNAVSYVGPAWEVAAVCDTDADGKSDIILRNTNTGYLLSWLMDGSTVTSNKLITNSADAPVSLPYDLWNVEGCADTDGDSKADLLWRHKRTGLTMIWKLDGAVATDRNYVTNSVGGNKKIDYNRWELESFVDMNGDGYADALWRNVLNGSTLLWMLNQNVVTYQNSVLDRSGDSKTIAASSWD